MAIALAPGHAAAMASAAYADVPAPHRMTGNCAAPDANAVDCTRSRVVGQISGCWAISKANKLLLGYFENHAGNDGPSLRSGRAHPQTDQDNARKEVIASVFCKGLHESRSFLAPRPPYGCSGGRFSHDKFSADGILRACVPL